MAGIATASGHSECEHSYKPNLKRIENENQELSCYGANNGGEWGKCISECAASD